MPKVIQLDFFEEPDMSALKAEFAEVKASCDRVRKKQFAEIGEIKKVMNDLVTRLEIIEKNICRIP